MFLYIQFFGPSFWRRSSPIPHSHHTTQFHLHSVVEHSPHASPLHYKLCRLWAQESVAGELQNPSLSSRCLAVIWLPRHPLIASPWEDCRTLRSLAIAIVRVPTGILPRYPLVACCFAVLSLCLRKETPREENSVGKLSSRRGTLAYIALSHFSSRQRYSSVSLEHTRRLWWSSTVFLNLCETAAQ